jgi:DENN (AEX-3) domain
LAPAPGVLLERQLVVFCPDMGVLSSVVLALVPLIRPFSWQSLLLPVMPAQEPMIDVLEVQMRSDRRTRADVCLSVCLCARVARGHDPFMDAHGCFSILGCWWSCVLRLRATSSELSISTRPRSCVCSQLRCNAQASLLFIRSNLASRACIACLVPPRCPRRLSVSVCLSVCAHAFGRRCLMSVHLAARQAPVPFILGVQYKTPEVRSRCAGLIRINVYKDQVGPSVPLRKPFFYFVFPTAPWLRPLALAPGMVL